MKPASKREVIVWAKVSACERKAQTHIHRYRDGHKQISRTCSVGVMARTIMYTIAAMSMPPELSMQCTGGELKRNARSSTCVSSGREGALGRFRSVHRNGLVLLTKPWYL